jgi:SAM-dependent methyltransferase
MPHPVTALSAWRRVLREGGRVAVVVFSTPDRNGWGDIPAAIIRRHAQLAPPAPGQPGPFSLGGPGVLEGVIRQAGFADPEVRAEPAPHGMLRAADYVRVAREAFGAFNAMMTDLPPAARESVWSEVEDALRGFESADGFEVPGECLVGAATK